MNAGLIAFSSGVLGLALGLLSMGILRRFERERHRTTVAEPALSDGAAQVLAVIGRAYVVVDEVGGVVQASPGAYAMGLVRGHTVLSIELAEMIRTVRHRGIFVEKELEIARGEDESLVIDLRVAPVGNEYILVLADDRTEISRVQRVRNDFVANVSHELKTPVGAISLLAEAIEEARDDPESIDYFTSRLHKETKRLTALVRDIIELSRLQSADVIGSGKLVSINSLVAEAVDRSKLAAEAKNITIHTDAHADREVYADPELLGIAVHNLIENAVRYSPEDTRVDVTVETSHENLLISVTDQGAGISEEDQKRIFERFYRVDPARSRQTGGTGLGLSIVKHVMAQHGGMVTVDSTLGEGSTFTLSLPLAEADHSTPEILESADNS
ncbi:sensor histidine kinase [Rothia dentocariosa]